MSLKESIEGLAEDLSRSNREIATVLGCSRRSVRRYVGRWSDRVRRQLKGKEGEAPLAEPAKILLLDIETSPLEVLTWGLFKQFLGPHQIIKDWAMLSWSAKWLFSATMMSQVVTPAEAIDHEDDSILLGLWDLLNEANIVIAHNGKRFDVRRVNARFAMRGLNPPMPYRVIDTMKVAQQNFDLSSYKLVYINQLFKVLDKDPQEFELWKDCLKGDAKALNQMKKYNESDVLAMEELYLRIRPWIKSHPPVGLYIDTDKEACANCGNTKLEWKGKYYTPAGRYAAFRCLSCGAVGRSRYADLSKEERKTLVVGAAM